MASVFPGSRAVHLAVVLRQVALDSVHICVRNVDAATSTLHDAASRHHCAWHSDELALDDIADQQLVRREVVFAFRVVPDMGVSILLIRLVFRIGPLAYPLLGRIAVPLAVGISQIEVLEARDGQASSFRCVQRSLRLRQALSE